MTSVETSISSLENLTRETAQEFAEFFNVAPFQADAIDENIEDVLSRLDELYGMLDLIRNDNNLAADKLLPSVRNGMNSLQPVFVKIDRLEVAVLFGSCGGDKDASMCDENRRHLFNDDHLKFVLVVKSNVIALEKEVKLVEQEFSALNSIKKAVTRFPLFSSKKKQPIHRALPRSFAPPAIFSTSEWLSDAKAVDEAAKSDDEIDVIKKETTSSNILDAADVDDPKDSSSCVINCSTPDQVLSKREDEVHENDSNHASLPAETNSP